MTTTGGGAPWMAWGATVDALDAPDALALREGWLRRRGRRPARRPPSDPFEALRAYFPAEWKVGGVLKAPDPFVPRPSSPLSRSRARRFLTQGGFDRFASNLSRTLSRGLGGARPVTVGVDHSSTLGVLGALARRGEAGGLLVLDAHLDARPDGLPLHAGNFLLHAVGTGLVAPRRLAVVGHPDAGSGPFAEGLALLRQAGALLVSRGEALGTRAAVLARALIDRVGPRPYLSIDADIGFPAWFESVRFADQPGLPGPVLGALVRALCSEAAPRGGLAGVDLMELDVHGLTTAEARRAVRLLRAIVDPEPGRGLPRRRRPPREEVPCRPV